MNADLSYAGDPNDISELSETQLDLLETQIMFDLWMERLLLAFAKRRLSNHMSKLYEMEESV